MRIFSAAVIVLCGAVEVAGQTPEPRSPGAGNSLRPPLTQIRMSLDRLQPTMTTQTQAIRRDAFIVTRLVAAVGALNDFQITAAVQAAIDEVEAARLHAEKNPRASAATLEMLDTIDDLLASTKRQGTMANLEAVQREILQRVEPLQKAMFAQLDDARRARLVIGEIETRLLQWDDAIDEAMIEALTASLSYTRHGGK